MQIDLWDSLEDLSDQIYSIFDSNFDKSDVVFDLDFPGWKDYFWESETIRKCHLKIIDHRETRNLWLMHINIFPRDNVDLPILGFDIVSGPKKITGAFFDFSHPNRNHELLNLMENITGEITWKKPRELPGWANEIFSENMIAAGNVREEAELEQLRYISLDLIKLYIKKLKVYNTDFTINQKDWLNKYCHNQKLNPHLHKSILAMGISEEDKDYYVNKFLFEEI